MTIAKLQSASLSAQMAAENTPAAVAEAPGTRIDAVMAAIRSRIAARALTPGAKLPSVRGFAKTMGVSVSTVVEAYERLAADGVIRSRPGAGFFVAGPIAPLSLSELGPRLDRDVDPLWVSRQSLEAGGEVLKPGCGWLPADWMPVASMRKALRGLSQSPDATLTEYGSPLGLPALRQLLSRRLSEHGVVAAPEQIMLADSGTQAIDLICRFLLEPGDTVLVDDPCYFNFHALLRAHRANVVGVPMTPEGPNIERFADALSTHRPRLYVTNAAIHNPTGAMLSPVVAHRILKLADQSGVTIVEDDIFADFELRAAPRLAAFDGLDRVIHIGSFSKTLSASARCGFIAAKPEWIEALTDLKVATSFGSSRFSAELVLSLLKDGGYRKHMDALKARLARAMDETAARLEPLGITPWLKPDAGIFLWCRLPDGRDAAEIARICLAQDVILAPGNVFSPGQTASNFMRFNVAQSGDERVYKVLREVLAA